MNSIVQDRMIPLAKLSEVNERKSVATRPTGRTPFRIIRGHDGNDAVLDADGRTCFIADSKICELMVTAANAYLPLIAEIASLREILEEKVPF